jgi:hypothetical protein
VFIGVKLDWTEMAGNRRKQKGRKNSSIKKLDDIFEWRCILVHLAKIRFTQTPARYSRRRRICNDI